MKPIIYISLLLAILVSCGEDKKKESIEQLIADKNIEGLKQQQQQLQQEYSTVTQKLSEIREALEKLDSKKQYPIVTTITVTDTLFQHMIQVQGSVDTKNNTVLFSEYSGTLQKLYVVKGQRVTKGQLIAKVNDGGLSEKLEQARVQYELAKTTYERQARLWEKKIGSEIQYLQAKAKVEGAERSVNQIKAQLAKTNLRAPFSGIIDDVPVKEGAVVQPGQTKIARLVNLNNMYVRADLPETYLDKIKKGTSVKVRFPAINQSVTSKIRQIGNFINPKNRTFYIEIDVPNKKGIIKPNLMASLEMADYSNENALIVPENIVKEDNEGNSFVYALAQKDNKHIAQRVSVKKGLTQGAFVEITEGLTSGMTLINEGSQGMQDGLVVEVKQATNETR